MFSFDVYEQHGILLSISHALYLEHNCLEKGITSRRLKLRGSIIVDSGGTRQTYNAFYHTQLRYRRGVNPPQPQDLSQGWKI